jgi:hypothetical protein
MGPHHRPDAEPLHSRQPAGGSLPFRSGPLT